MAPSRATEAVSDEDEDVAPETVTLSQSKQHVKRLDEARLAAESEAKRRKKERNKRMDETLKKRALETRGAKKARTEGEISGVLDERAKESNGQAADEDSRRLEVRMNRTMREAEEEDSDEREILDETGTHRLLVSGLDEEASSESEAEKDDAPMNDISESEDDDGQPGGEHPQDTKPDYLPEHLFSEALSKAQAQTQQKTQLLNSSVKSKRERKRKSKEKRSTKDVVLGSKVIRTHPPRTGHISSAASRTLPPVKVKRFYEDRLNLKAKSNSRSRGGWDRKAANIGIMRSSTLPAANFVRNG